MFQAAKQTKVFQNVVEQIQEAIFDGRLKTGETLPAERELKSMYNKNCVSAPMSKKTEGTGGEKKKPEAGRSGLKTLSYEQSQSAKSGNVYLFSGLFS